MGYSSNRAVLDARRSQLTDLELGRACSWTTVPDRDVTRRKAYEIREALYIASLYPEDYPALDQARYNFEITIVRPGLIEAKPKASADADLKLHYPTPVHGVEPLGRPVATVGPATAAEVIKAWQDHAPSLDAINFQQSRLGVSELTALWHWANEHKPRLMVLAGEGFVTLSLRDAEVADYAWSPPKAPQPEEKFNV